jgi:hypothetical protein
LATRRPHPAREMLPTGRQCSFIVVIIIIIIIVPVTPRGHGASTADLHRTVLFAILFRSDGLYSWLIQFPAVSSNFPFGHLLQYNRTVESNCFETDGVRLRL